MSDNQNLKIFYARVSSKDQNLDRQIEQAHKDGYSDRFVYTEKQSGKSIEARPVLKEALGQLRAGDVLQVMSLDRLSRNYGDIKQIMQEIKSKGAKLVVDDLPVTDSGNELVDSFMMDMMISLMAFVAENERKKIRERQAQGIAEAKKRGVYKGRKVKYEANSSDRDGRNTYDKIKRDYLSGNYESKAKLARDNELSRTQLYRILKRIDAEQEATTLA